MTCCTDIVAEVPADLEEVIVGGIMTDRRERYSDAGTFRDKLAAVSLT